MGLCLKPKSVLCLTELEIERLGVNDGEGLYIHALLTVTLITERRQMDWVLSFDSAHFVSVPRMPTWALATGLDNN